MRENPNKQVLQRYPSIAHHMRDKPLILNDGYIQYIIVLFSDENGYSFLPHS